MNWFFGFSFFSLFRKCQLIDDRYFFSVHVGGRNDSQRRPLCEYCGRRRIPKPLMNRYYVRYHFSFHRAASMGTCGNRISVRLLNQTTVSSVKTRILYFFFFYSTRQLHVRALRYRKTIDNTEDKIKIRIKCPTRINVSGHCVKKNWNPRGIVVAHG